MDRRILACGFLATCLLTLNASAQVTWYVDDDAFVLPLAAQFGTIDLPFGSIGQAFSICMDNDRIVVLPGTYSPSLTGETFPYQWGSTANTNSHFNIEIVSRDGPATTIIDSEGGTSGFGIFRFRNLAAGARLQGFTFRNHQGTTGAIRLGSSTSSFEATDVEITQCAFENGIYGIAVFGASDLLKIHDNFFIGNSDAQLWLSDITTNPTIGGGPSGGEVYNNTIVNGNNGGIRLQGGTWTIRNNLIVGHTNRGIFDFGTIVPPVNYSFSYSMDYNCIFGNGVDWDMITPGPNSISVDPLFANGTGTTLADFQLMPGSPCQDAGGLPLPISVSADIDGDPRIVGPAGASISLPDIGSDEVTDVRLTLTSASVGLGIQLRTDGPAGHFQLKFASLGRVNNVFANGGNLLLDQASIALLEPSATFIPPSGSEFFTSQTNLPGFLLGVTFWSQAVVFDPGVTSIRFTNLVEVNIGL